MVSSNFQFNDDHSLFADSYMASGLSNNHLLQGFQVYLLISIIF